MTAVRRGFVLHVGHPGRWFWRRWWYVAQGAGESAARRILCIVFSAVFLVSGCAMNGTSPSAEGRVSAGMIDKTDPEKSFGELLLEKIAEGNFKRRTIGWIDRTT